MPRPNNILRRPWHGRTNGLFVPASLNTILISPFGADDGIFTLMKNMCKMTMWLVLLSASSVLMAADAVFDGTLPAPHRTGGKPVMQALQERHSTREFKPDTLDSQQMSDLLWAAFGINRPEIEHRTAPSAVNAQDVDIYIALASGLYRYDAKPHRMVKVSDADVRPLSTGQPFGKVAPIQLIYISDYARMAKVAPESRSVYSGVDTGCIVENVYLFCASEGLACVVHELDHDPMAKAMNLRSDQHIIVAQAVGFPK
jgi:nitroreductase